MNLPILLLVFALLGLVQLHRPELGRKLALGAAAACGALLLFLLSPAALGVALFGTITTGVPTNIFAPGTYHTFLFSTGQRGLTPLPQRVLMVGTMLATGTATAGVPVQIFDAADAATKFGQGSPVTLMCRKALGQASFQKVSPEIWAVGIAEPAGGGAAKNVHTLTLTGPATADGNVIIRIMGRTITTGVQNGQSANTVAAAMQQSIASQHADLRVIATVVGAVVTCTDTVTGENGGDVVFTTVQTPAGIAIAHATGTAGVGITDVTASLDAAIDRDYHGIALENHKAADIADAVAHTSAKWAYNVKRYRWIFIADTTSLSSGNALAAAANDFTVHVIGCEDSPSLPAEIAAASATRVWGTQRANANYDGMGLLIYPPTTSSSVYTGAEVESALQSGQTPLIPDITGQRVKFVRLVTTKVTTASAPDYSTFDLASSRVAALMAQQIDIRYAKEFTGEDAIMDLDEDSDEYVVNSVRDMVIGIHRDFEALRYIQHVDEHIDEILVAPNGIALGRLDCANPFEVISPLHQTAFRHHVQIG